MRPLRGLTPSLHRRAARPSAASPSCGPPPPRRAQYRSSRVNGVKRLSCSEQGGPDTCGGLTPPTFARMSDARPTVAPMWEQATYLEVENSNARAIAIVLDELHRQGAGAEQIGNTTERRSMDHVVGALGAVGTIVVYKIGDKLLDAAIDAAIDTVKAKWGVIVRRRPLPPDPLDGQTVVDDTDAVRDLWRMDNDARRRQRGE